MDRMRNPAHFSQVTTHDKKQRLKKKTKAKKLFGSKKTIHEEGKR